MEPNTSVNPRAGAVTIAGRSFTVTQPGQPDTAAPAVRITTPDSGSVTTAGQHPLMGTVKDEGGERGHW